MKLLKRSLILLTATLLSSSLMADAFDVTYDFTNTGDPTSVTGDVSGSTVTPLGYSGWANIGSSTIAFRSNFTPSAQSDSAYISFTLTPTTPGETLDFTSFAFSLGGRDGNENTSIVSVNLRIGETGADFSSLPDVVFMPGSVSTATHTVVGPTSNTFTDYTADLSAPAYQDMESAEVRLYYFDNTGGSNMYGAIDYISMSGAAVVPEVSTAAMVLSATVLLLAFNGRRVSRRGRLS